jgi:hypothetical protein
MFFDHVVYILCLVDNNNRLKFRYLVFVAIPQILSAIFPRSCVRIKYYKISEAIAYTLNHRKQLCRFLDDGRIPIDNNLVENTIRPIAIGRKNWLFAGSPEGARRLAIIYSIVATCKLNYINPYEYLYDVLPKIASYTANKIADLTPLIWLRLKNN